MFLNLDSMFRDEQASQARARGLYSRLGTKHMAYWAPVGRMKRTVHSMSHPPLPLVPSPATVGTPPPDLSFTHTCLHWLCSGCLA